MRLRFTSKSWCDKFVNPHSMVGALEIFTELVDLQKAMKVFSKDHFHYQWVVKLI